MSHITEMRDILDHLGIGQLELGRLCGLSGRTVRRWVHQDHRHPLALMRGVRELHEATGEDPREIIKRLYGTNDFKRRDDNEERAVD